MLQVNDVNLNIYNAYILANDYNNIIVLCEEIIGI